MKVINPITIVMVVNILLLAAEMSTSSRVLKSEDSLIDGDDNIFKTQNVPSDWYNGEGSSTEKCIRLHGAISVQFDVDDRIIVEDVPKNAKPSGSCDSDQQYIELIWTTQSSNSSEDVRISLTMSFQKHTTNYRLENITLDWKATTGNSSGNIPMSNMARYETSLNSSYKCNDAIKIKSYDFIINFHDLHFQAFFSFPNDTVPFSHAKECPDIGQAVLEMMGLLVGCLFVFSILVVVFVFILKKLRPVEFGYLNVS